MTDPHMVDRYGRESVFDIEFCKVPILSPDRGVSRRFRPPSKLDFLALGHSVKPQKITYSEYRRTPVRIQWKPACAPARDRAAKSVAGEALRHPNWSTTLPDQINSGSHDADSRILRQFCNQSTWPVNVRYNVVIENDEELSTDAADPAHPGVIQSWGRLVDDYHSIVLGRQSA